MQKNEKIKICHVASVDMTLRFMLWGKLKFLRNEGYEVHAVSSPGKWVTDLEQEGIKVKTIRFKRKISPISDLVAFLKLFFYFKKEKFHIVHTHTLKPQFFGQIAAKLAGIPIIINTIHGFDFGEETSLTERRFFIFLEKISAKYSSLIFAISRKIIETAIKESICKSGQIKYLGRDIDTARFNPKRFSKKFISNKKRELNIDLNKKIIGIVARLVEEKGFLELFQAFKKVINKSPDTLLLVIGPKETEKRDAIDPEIVKKYGIEKNIIFLGERIDVDELYSMMDIFVLPTHREGLGAAILEASSMEVPTIATNTGGCPETINDGKTGILVPLKDSKKLSEAIIYLLSNPEIARKMGKEGRKKILKEFNQNIVFERMKEEYERLIKRHQFIPLDKEWLKKYSKVARKGEEEHRMLYLSKESMENYRKYFFEYFKPYTKEKSVNSQMKILDAGCGVGSYAKVLSQKGFDVYGIDYVPDFIALAKQNTTDKKAHFQVSEIYQLPFKDDYFDIVFSVGVFQCLSYPRKALREMKRVLKKKGKAIIITLNQSSISSFGQGGYHRQYKPYLFQKVMREEGFSVTRLKGLYLFPQDLNFLVDVAVNLKLYKLFNSLFRISKLFAHSFYIEGEK